MDRRLCGCRRESVGPLAAFREADRDRLYPALSVETKLAWNACPRPGGGRQGLRKLVQPPAVLRQRINYWIRISI